MKVHHAHQNFNGKSSAFGVESPDMDRPNARRLPPRPGSPVQNSLPGEGLSPSPIEMGQNTVSTGLEGKTNVRGQVAATSMPAACATPTTMVRPPVLDDSDPRRVVTPLDANGFEDDLRSLGILDRWSHIIEGLRHGFDVGVKAHTRGGETIIDPNHNSCSRSPQFISDYIASEMATGRYSRGYTPIELESRIGPFRTSPLGLIPKSDSFRLIQDFSFPRNDPIKKSVNSSINSDDFPTEWGTFDKTAEMILKLPDGCEAATFDISSAYRLTPVAPEQQWALCLYWEGKVYVDRAVAFGSASSAGVFGSVADMLAAIYEATRTFGPLVKWVDDFFVTKLPHQSFTETDFMELTGRRGVPWSIKKLRPFKTVQRYLGYDWDLQNKTVSMPQEKIDACQELLAKWTKRGAMFTIREAESLHGKLVHMSSLFRLIRPFLPTITSFIRNIPNLHARHHPPSALVKDLHWTSSLLNDLPNSAPLSYMEPEDLGWWGDASTSFGIGIVVGKFWAAWRWAPSFQPGPGSEFNIGWAEAVAIELGLLLVVRLGDQINRHPHHNHILVYSDNAGVVDILKKGRSKSTQTNTVLKRIHLLLASSGLVLLGRHVTSRENVTDALSRGDITAFLSGYPAATTKVSFNPPPSLGEKLLPL